MPRMPLQALALLVALAACGGPDPEAPSVRGVVRTPDGRPLEGQTVVAARSFAPAEIVVHSDAEVLASDVTDAAGEFELASVPEGTWAIGVTPLRSIEPGVEPVPPVATTLAVARDRAPQEVELVAEPGLWIEGEIGAPEGARGVALGVWAGTEDDAHNRLLVVTRGTSFRVGPLFDRPYRLLAMAREPGMGVSRSRVVTARPGQEGVVLELQPACSLRGRVVAPEGTDFEGTALQWTHTETFTGSVVPLGDGGEFVIEGLEPGRYDLAGAVGDRMALAAAVPANCGEAEPAPVLVELEPRGDLRIALEGTWRHYRLRVRRGDVLVGGGKFESGSELVMAVPAGDLEVRVLRGAQEIALRRLTVAPGQTADLRLDMD